MAKEDFCFTYYDGDAARDKAHMTRLCRGAYDDFISMQRKVGHLSINVVKMILSTDFEICWPSLKFILKTDDLGNFFIEWVDNSIEKMRKNSAKQKENVNKRWDKKISVGITKGKESYTVVSNNDDLVIPLVNENGDVLKGVQGEFLWTEIVKNFHNDFRWKEKFCRDKRIRLQDLEVKQKEFISDIELKEDFKDLKELKNHFTNWFNKNKTLNHIAQPVGNHIDKVLANLRQ